MNRPEYKKWMSNIEVQKKLVPVRELQSVLLELLLVIDRVCVENNLRYYLFYGTLLGAVRDGGFIPWDDDADIVMPRADYEKLLYLPEEKWPSGYFLQSPYSEKNGRFAFAKLRKKGTTCIDPHHRHIRMHQGIFLDIFPMDETGKWSVLLWNVPRFFERMAALKCARLPESMKLFKPFKWIWEFFTPSASCFNRIGNFFARCLSYRGGRYLDTFSTDRSSRASAGWKVDLFEPHKRVSFEGHELSVPKCSEEILGAYFGAWQEWPPEEERKPIHSDGGVIDTERDYTEYLKDCCHVW
ncbi:MAG: LicD family protein [bacterium]|nr:LicD family protein [bacterium]